MKVEVIEDKLQPGDWRVEMIDTESDGECYVAIFSGPLAKERAHEYGEIQKALLWRLMADRDISNRGLADPDAV